MNYVSFEHFLNIGKKLILSSILISSFWSLSTLVVNASGYDDEIVTVNINESDETVVSNMVSEVYHKPDENLKKTNLQNVSFSHTGFSIGKMLAKSIPVILDSCLVPDGEGVCNSLNKTYMAYTAVTSRNSAQYRLLYGDSAHTDEETGLRMVDDRICIAVGTFYANRIGTKLDLVMENGNVVKCILGDVKSDRHTDPTHRFQAQDGSVAEMIVDYEYFNSTKQYPDELRGRISRIEVVE